jgi:thiol-disulfide isomerase/thioredoxin
VSNLNWLTDLDQAKKESIETKKPIIMYFTGSDWCGPCKMLKADFFSSDKFNKTAEDLILVKVDIPRRMDIITPAQLEKNRALVRKYNRQGSYPNLVALNENGKVIGSLNGYTFLRETDRHFAFVESIIENYY